MKYKTIYIYCPTIITVTGGTELLHQLGDKLNALNIENYLVYCDDPAGSKIEAAFVKYNYKVARKVIDSSENLLIVPETGISFSNRFHKINKAIWWESVDNYTGSCKNKTSLLKHIYHKLKFFKDRCTHKQDIHFVQSYYAQEWIMKYWHVDKKKIFPLSDYLNSSFISDASNSNSIRSNIVLYNPKKGFEFTKKIIEYCSGGSYSFVPIQGMKPSEVSQLMRKSKLYIDFGNHPGKDRMPREAAISGCCVITGKRGAAANPCDIEIEDEFKFNDDQNLLPRIKEMIEYVMNDFEKATSRMEPYRKKIKLEEKVFDEQILCFFEKN